MADWPEDSGLQCDAFDDMQTEKIQPIGLHNHGHGGQEASSCGLGSLGERIALIDYIAYEGFILESIGIAIRQTKGDTPDGDVSKLHYDLGNLTVKRLARLTEIISTGEHKRIPKQAIKASLHKAVRDGRLNMAGDQVPNDAEKFVKGHQMRCQEAGTWT